MKAAPPRKRNKYMIVSLLINAIDYIIKATPTIMIPTQPHAFATGFFILFPPHAHYAGALDEIILSYLAVYLNK